MAIDNGDMVISAGCFMRPSGGAAVLNKGTLVPDGVNIGIYETSGAGQVAWNNGRNDAASYALTNLRKVTPYSGSDFFGKRVTLSDVAAAFEGIVIQQFNTELSGTNDTGVQVPVCVVRAQGFTYIAEPADLVEI